MPDSGKYPDLLPTEEDRQEHDAQLAAGEYNLAASRALDIHHEAIDENPDDVTGTCAICPFADGWRTGDGWGHYTQSSVEEVQTWMSDPSRRTLPSRS